MLLPWRCFAAVAVERSKLRTTRPQLLQIQRIGRQVTVIRQHARGVWPTQTGTGYLLRRTVYLRTERRRRFLGSPLHRKAGYLWVSFHCLPTYLSDTADITVQCTLYKSFRNNSKC